MAERVIGIDFGTSTSVIRVRRYEGEKAIDAIPNAVTFNNGSALVPTLIRKLSKGQSTYYGFDAEVPKRATTLYRDFKLNLEDADESKREIARQLTAEYLRYLGTVYKHQSETGFLGENNDTVETYISYPVKWSQSTRDFMIEATKKAGFSKVEGMDEAQACIRAVTEQYANMLTAKGYFKEDQPCTILLIDMGAGTTDLCLCRHIPGAKETPEILSTWPKGEVALFGGHIIDEILYNYIISEFPDEKAVQRIPLSAFKTWKETVVSPALLKGETVDYFAALQQIEIALDTDLVFDPIDRKKFEELASDYLAQLPEMIKDTLNDAKVAAKDVDLVILTGGHCQWYFVHEMLTDSMKQFGTIGLERIKKEPQRIISLERPQETVALGLVYKVKPISFPIKQNDEIYTSEIVSGPQKVEKTSNVRCNNKILSNTILNQATEKELTLTEEGKVVLDETSFFLFREDIKNKIKEYEKHVPQNIKTAALSTFKSNVRGFDDEEVYYIHQDELSPKYGFIITNRGFHVQGSGLEGRRFYSWEEFIRCDYFKENRGLVGVCETEWETYQIYLTYDPHRRTNKMIIHLHDYIKGKYALSPKSAVERLKERILESTNNCERNRQIMIRTACKIFLEQHPEFVTDKQKKLIASISYLRHLERYREVLFACHSSTDKKDVYGTIITDEGISRKYPTMFSGTMNTFTTFDELAASSGEIVGNRCFLYLKEHYGREIASGEERFIPELKLLLTVLCQICKEYR